MPTVRYFVKDVDASIAFYGQLGFTLVERMGPPFAMIEKDGLTLWLSGPATSAARPMPDGQVPAPGGWNRIVIEVEDLDKTYCELKESGCKFRNEPISGPGGSQVLAEDPDSNPIEIFQPRSR